MSEIKIGLQMYTVRDECDKGFEATLRNVAKIGYEYIELAGMYDLTPQALKAVLDETGLKALSTHEGFDGLKADTKPVIEYCKVLGIQYVVCPWVPDTRGNDGVTGAKWESIARDFEVIGRKIREAGLVFGYHNHDHEFLQFDGKYALDILLDNTSPENLSLELDAGWAYYAGVDPAGYIRNHKSRMALIHAKDHDKADKTLNRPVGDGALDWKDIFAACRETGVQGAIVEEDRCIAPPLESVAKSLANLKAMGIA
jgi:sugar phosphate isomerase/epimerase